MPDSITPVGAMIQPPDPSKGLGLMSSMLGIQQQRQNLQTGQYQQATAQADSQQAQQKNAELQAVGNLTKNAGSYKKGDGTFDSQKFSDDVNRVAPTYGPTVANQATSKAGMIYDNQQKLLSLSSDRRQKLADTYGALAADPTADHAKYVKAMQDIVKQYPNDTAMSDLAISSMGSMPNTEGQPLQQWARNAAIAAKSPTAVQTDPVISTMQGQNGLQAVNTNPQSPGGIGPRGEPIPQGLAPTEKIPYKAAAAGAGARGGGSGNADISASDNVIAAQRDAKTNIDLTKRIDQLADVVAPGALPEKIRSGLGALGLQSASQAQTELEKDLGRLRGPLALRAGSDSRAAEALEGLPNVKTPTQTIHQAMDFNRGMAKQDLALGQLREKNATATGGNMNGFSSQYAHATGAASPLMHEYWSLPKGEQAQFLKRNSSSPQQAQELRNRFEAARGQLNVGQ